MSATDKTKNLIRRMWPVNAIEANPDNPNEMTAAQFNMLYENIEAMGVTDPLFCVPHPDKPCDPEKGTGTLLLIGGEHRWEVSKLHDIPEIPVTINTDPDFNEDMQKFQIVRHNIIHGQMSPAKFTKLYESLTDEYTEEVAAEMFGFVDQAEFDKLLKKTKDSLPPEMKESFEAASKEIKTINDLTSVLNHLFNTYGDTLDYNYMILDYAGKESVWLRMPGADFDTFKKMAEACKDSKRTVDHFVTALMKRVSNDESLFNEIVQELPEFEFSDSIDIATLDFLDNDS